MSRWIPCPWPWQRLECSVSFLGGHKFTGIYSISQSSKCLEVYRVRHRTNTEFMVLYQTTSKDRDLEFCRGRCKAVPGVQCTCMYGTSTKLYEIAPGSRPGRPRTKLLL